MRGLRRLWARGSALDVLAASLERGGELVHCSLALQARVGRVVLRLQHRLRRSPSAQRSRAREWWAGLGGVGVRPQAACLSDEYEATACRSRVACGTGRGGG